MSVTLDAIDRQILALLQEDGSLSVTDVADRLGMTPPPCRWRIRRFKDAGVLERQVWIANSHALGLSVTIFATVRFATHDIRTRRGRSVSACTNCPEVMECHIVVPSITYYERLFYQTILQLPAVREVNSSVAVSEVKRSFVLPQIEE